LSNTEPGLEGGSFIERRKHSDYVHYVPECQLRAVKGGGIDLEIECKMKNLAVARLAGELGLLP
jgi:vancomycin resistance protein YoaR